MFRKMRRYKQEINEQECVDILEEQPRGVLAVFGENGYPYAFPMDYIYISEKLYFHCAKEGHKTDAITSNNKVSFCVMDEGYTKEGEWPLNIRSVVIFGSIKRIDDATEILEITRQLGLKYYPSIESVEEEIQKSITKLLILELSIDHMTGKLVNES